MNTGVFFYVWTSQTQDFISTVMFWLASFLVVALFPLGGALYFEPKPLHIRHKYLCGFSFLLQSIGFVMVVVTLFWEVTSQ
jgi:hypothetical protein